MNQEGEFDFKELERLLIQFLKGKSGIIKAENRINSTTFHYFNEIVRCWNRLNFLLIRLALNPKKKSSPHLSSTAKILYVLFRYYEEKAELQDIFREIPNAEFDDRFIKKLKRLSFEEFLENKPPLEKISLKHAYPTFMIRNLLPYMDIEFLKKNLIYMNSYHPKTNLFSFYVNPLKFSNHQDIDAFITRLKSEKIDVLQDKDYTSLFYTLLKNKKKIILSEEWKSRKIVILDKGSLAVAILIQPEENELIGDYCAAPGIKSFILAQLSNDKSRIVASDFLYKRVKGMKKYLKNTSVKSIFLLNCDSITPSYRLDLKFDKILLDAPCTGSGTFLSNPELKWRQNSNFLNQNVVLQTKLLSSALNHLKPGGILLYSTCSLYAEEGELQIIKFQDRLAPINLPDWISPSYTIEGKPIKGTGRLFPSIHSTKGFFIGKFKKKE